jgi:hypothetical protein
MNASRLRELVDLLLQVESKLAVQKRFTVTATAFAELVAATGDANLQVKFKESLDALKSVWHQMMASFDPIVADEIAGIGAAPYFTVDMIDQIGMWVNQNTLTPTLAHKELGDYVARRQEYLATLNQMKANLDRLNVKPSALEPGSAEIGFLIPRAIFEDDLEGLARELGVIRRIVRPFSELATGAVEPVRVREISTTDPLIFLLLNPLTIAMVAGAVTWTLDTLKRVMEIRKLRQDMNKTKAFTDEEIEKFVGPKVKALVDKAIEEKGVQLLAPVPDSPRKHEQRTDLHNALELLLDRVDRGMRVELRLSPPVASDGEQSAEAKTQAMIFAELKQISQQLTFLPPNPEPLRRLSAPADGVAAEEERGEPPRPKGHKPADDRPVAAD